MINLEALRNCLATIPSGPVDDRDRVQDLLTHCWSEFDGHNAERMNASKLSRIQELEWNAPILSFKIERHGGTVCGSSRADVHAWYVDTEQLTASWAKCSHRQLRPMASRLDVRPMVAEVVDLIAHGQEDERLKWFDDGRVKVQIGKVLPKKSAVKRTLEGRRKRFHAMLSEELQRVGWEEIDKFTYRKCTREDGPSAVLE